MERCKYGMLGRRRPDRNSLLKVPRLASFLASDFPAPPAALDCRGGVKQWGMLGNDRAGDCVWAALIHAIMARTAAATGTPMAFTDDDAISVYSAVTGYDPATGDNDNGTDIRTALEYHRQTGLKGDKLTAYVGIDPTNPLEIRIAMSLFGPLICGITLPKSAEQQTDAGQPWDLVYWTHDLGGHAITLAAYGSSGYTGQTWGQDQEITERFISRECDELYAVVDVDYLNAKGVSPTGLDLTGLLNASAKFGS